MRVTYCTKVVQKPSVCFFSYWKFLKVWGSFCIVVKTRAGMSNISANWKCIHFFWAVFGLRNDHTMFAQCPPPSDPTLPTVQQVTGIWERLMSPRMSSLRSSKYLNSLFPHMRMMLVFKLSSLAQWRANSCSSRGRRTFTPFVAKILPWRLMDSQQSRCEDIIAALR